MGFKRSLIDLCLLHMNDNKGDILLCLYVNVVLCIRDEAAITSFIKELSGKFAIKNQGVLDEYVGCKVVSNDDCTKIWITNLIF